MLLTMITNATITLADLRFMIIKCMKCSTEVTVDISESARRIGKKIQDPHALPNYDNATPRCCPICDTVFDSSLTQGANCLRDGIIDLIKQETVKIEFKVQNDAISSK